MRRAEMLSPPNEVPGLFFLFLSVRISRRTTILPLSLSHTHTHTHTHTLFFALSFQPSCTPAALVRISPR